MPLLKKTMTTFIYLSLVNNCTGDVFSHSICEGFHLEVTKNTYVSFDNCS